MNRGQRRKADREARKQRATERSTLAEAVRKSPSQAKPRVGAVTAKFGATLRLAAYARGLDEEPTSETATPRSASIPSISPAFVLDPEDV